MAQCFVGRLLLCRTQGGGDVQARGIGQFAVLRIDLLAHHLGSVFGVHLSCTRPANDQLLGHGLCVLLLGDDALAAHA